MRATIAGVLLLLAVPVPVSATAGWYLLSPIIALDGDSVEKSTSAKAVTDPPLSQWHHEGAFDSARECNAQRERNWQKDFALWREKDKASRPWLVEAFFMRSQAAVCIASDDPRLK